MMIASLTILILHAGAILRLIARPIIYRPCPPALLESSKFCIGGADEYRPLFSLRIRLIAAGSLLLVVALPYLAARMGPERQDKKDIPGT